MLKPRGRQHCFLFLGSRYTLESLSRWLRLAWRKNAVTCTYKQDGLGLWIAADCNNHIYSPIEVVGNKITFKQTQSLSNAACFKHDNNVCACAVSALILLPVVNLSLEIGSATSVSYNITSLHVIVGGRAFPVAATQFWNRLPDNVTSANLLSAFQQQLKHTLFQQSFPDIIMWHFLTVTPIVVSSGIAT